MLLNYLLDPQGLTYYKTTTSVAKLFIGSEGPYFCTYYKTTNAVAKLFIGSIGPYLL